MTEYYSQGSYHGDKSSNHIALIQGSYENHLAFVADNITEDYEWHNVELRVDKSNIKVSVDNRDYFDIDENIDRTFNDLMAMADLFKELAVDASLLLHNAYKENKTILFEGAQGSMLDVDLGDRKSTRLNSSHIPLSRMPSSA